MSDIRLDLAEPLHGWLPVTLRLDDDELHWHASYIVDCITDLVYAALELLEARPVRPIFFYEEPDAARLSLVARDDVIDLAITHHPDLTTAQNAQRGTPLLMATVERIPLARAIWAALRRLEGAVDHARLESAWRRPFPSKEVAQLGAALRSL